MKKNNKIVAIDNKEIAVKKRKSFNIDDLHKKILHKIDNLEKTDDYIIIPIDDKFIEIKSLKLRRNLKFKDFLLGLDIGKKFKKEGKDIEDDTNEQAQNEFLLEYAYSLIIQDEEQISRNFLSNLPYRYGCLILFHAKKILSEIEKDMNSVNNELLVIDSDFTYLKVKDEIEYQKTSSHPNELRFSNRMNVLQAHSIEKALSPFGNYHDVIKSISYFTDFDDKKIIENLTIEEGITILYNRIDLYARELESASLSDSQKKKKENLQMEKK